MNCNFEVVLNMANLATLSANDIVVHTRGDIQGGVYKPRVGDGAVEVLCNLTNNFFGASDVFALTSDSNFYCVLVVLSSTTRDRHAHTQFILQSPDT